MCAAALVAPAPAAAAGGKLSMEKARHTANVYAAEICAADARCQGYEVGKCVRLGPKKVLCKTRLDRKQGVTCRYKITIKKVDGEVRGRVGEITCSEGS